jgi:hypothetical protein
VVHPEYTKSEEGLVSFFGMVRQVGGAKLLPRKPRHETREDDEGEEEGGDADAEEDVREDEDTVVRLCGKSVIKVTGNRGLTCICMSRMYRVSEATGGSSGW